jgi:hypothetical protein
MGQLTTHIFVFERLLDNLAKTTFITSMGVILWFVKWWWMIENSSQTFLLVSKVL